MPLTVQIELGLVPMLSDLLTFPLNRSDVPPSKPFSSLVQNVEGMIV